MAIKGKGKTRSRRPIAAPPRPQLVIRKRPLWTRRSTWVALGAAVLVAVAAMVAIGVRNNNREDRLALEAKAVREFSTLVAVQLPPGAQPLGPTNWLLFPTAQQDLAGIEAGDVGGDDATEKADALKEAAASAGDAIEAVRIPQIVPADFPETRNELNSAQFLMVQGIRGFERVGGLMRAAAMSSGERRASIVDEATLLANQAADLFDRGWLELSNVQARVGVSIDPGTLVPPAPQPSAAPSAPSPAPAGSPGAPSSPVSPASPTVTPQASPSASAPTASPTG
jgi:hypothetical protein